MRTQGTLIKWNEDRGFGFAKTRDTGVEVFAHVSEFPRSGRRPQIGDPLSFEIVSGDDGRKRARAIVFDMPAGRADFTIAPVERAAKPTPTHSMPTAGTHQARQTRSHPRRPRDDRGSGPVPKLIVGGLLVVGAVFGYRQFIEHRAVAVDALRGNSAPATAIGTTTPASPIYRCDGRQHCSQMSSCAEATWFIRNCPDTKMDGDSDGIPCEQGICN